MSRSITISYNLHPPKDTPAPADNLSTSKSLEFPVTTKESLPKYYEALRASIAQAKDAVGEDLTAWRDAVGNRELKKEPKPAAAAVDEEDEEDEDEE